MLNDVGILWVQVQLPHLKPIVICCYSPPDADVDYLIQLCEMIKRVSDMNSDIYLLGNKNTKTGMMSTAQRREHSNIYLCYISSYISCFPANNISH